MADAPEMIADTDVRKGIQAGTAAVVRQLERENARLRAALRPFAARVFNDNGDMTVSASRAKAEHFCDAYLAYHKEPTNG